MNAPFVAPTRVDGSARQAAPGAAPRPNTAAFMRSVYNWMAAGLVLTGVVGHLVATNDQLIAFIFQYQKLMLIGQFLLAMAFSGAIGRVGFGTAAVMFTVYCAFSGVTTSLFFYVFTRESVAIALYVTGGTFAAMSAWGTITKRDLSGWGHWLGMAVAGLVIATLANWFIFDSNNLQLVTSAIGVVVFVLLTAYDTQKIREMAANGDRSFAILGALRLYLDFILVFKFLLILFGRRR